MSSLAGKRVLVTRPAQQSDGLLDQLSRQGALPVAFPTIAIVPDPEQLARLDQALRALAGYDWLIFTSQNAVDLFLERFERTQTSRDALRGVKVAAIGPATERALRERGVSVQWVPDEYVGEAITRGIGEVRGLKVLLPRAQAARAALVEGLTLKGALVDEIPLYQTITNQPAPEAWQELQKGVDFITFTSASTVKGFFTLLGARAKPLLDRAVTACIGPITASALEEYGTTAQIIADDYTAEGLVQAMLAYTKRMEREGNQ